MKKKAKTLLIVAIFTSSLHVKAFELGGDSVETISIDNYKVGMTVKEDILKEHGPWYQSDFGFRKYCVSIINKQSQMMGSKLNVAEQREYRDLTFEINDIALAYAPKTRSFSYRNDTTIGSGMVVVSGREKKVVSVGISNTYYAPLDQVENTIFSTFNFNLSDLQPVSSGSDPYPAYVNHTTSKQTNKKPYEHDGPGGATAITRDIQNRFYSNEEISSEDYPGDYTLVSIAEFSGTRVTLDNVGDLSLIVDDMLALGELCLSKAQNINSKVEKRLKSTPLKL